MSCKRTEHEMDDEFHQLQAGTSISSDTLSSKEESHQFLLSILKALADFNTSKTSTLLSGEIATIWKLYKEFVQNYAFQINFADDIITRILFWIPHNSSNDYDMLSQEGKHLNTTFASTTAWREVCYGILSLHRLLMHLAQVENSSIEQVSNCYGMSIQPQDRPNISATAVRIWLTVIQSIMPSILAIAASTTPTKAATTSFGHSISYNTSKTSHSFSIISQMEQRKAKVRLFLEQIKFILRMYLLVQYWKQQQHQQTNNSSSSSSSTNTNTNTTQSNDPLIGILMDGGMYRVTNESTVGLSYNQARALQRRQQYVGKRTGWKIAMSSSQDFGQDNNTIVKYTIAADLLNAIRPLLWAWFESTYPRGLEIQEHGQQTNFQSVDKQMRRNLVFNTWSTSNQKLLKGWLLCLGIDLVSIRLLDACRKGRDMKNYVNPYTESEIRRRKVRLLLYALRSPIWSQATIPLLDRFSRRILQKIPLLGSLTETFIWDWILYYQHPFIAEEG